MQIGFIGTGQMGSRMAGRLLDAGHTLLVHDTRREAAKPLLERGARWADSPWALAENTSLVISMLPGPREVEQIVYGAQGLLGAWKQGDIFMDMSTSLPTTTQRVAADAVKKGVAVLDAPVTGGVTGAAAGTLTIMVGGSAEALQRVSGVLSHLGKTVIHMGDVGCGNVTKIVNNLIAVTCNAINSEAFVLGARAGIDTKKLWQAVTSGSGNNLPLQHGWPNTVFQGNFKPGFMLNLALKDVSLAMSLAAEYAIPLPVAATVQQRLVEAKAAGMGEMASTAGILRLEELAGVKVRFAP